MASGLGPFCLTMATYGLLSAIGLLQIYRHKHRLRIEWNSKISRIPSMFGFLACFPSSPAGVLFDMSRLYDPVASIEHAVPATFVGPGFSATSAQFMASSIVAGISAGTLNSICRSQVFWKLTRTFRSRTDNSGFSVVSHGFQIRRGLALGFVNDGTAFGDIFFSLVLKALFSQCHVPPRLADLWFGPLNTTIVMSFSSLLVVSRYRAAVWGSICSGATCRCGFDWACNRQARAAIRCLLCLH